MARIELIAAHHSHVLPIADRMRREDVHEVYAAAGMSPRGALALSLATSDMVKTVTADGRPEQMYGRYRIPGTTFANVWLLGTEAVCGYKTFFYRNSGAELLAMLSDGVEVLTNHVHHANRFSLRWLKWLGAEFGPEQSWGKAGEPFMEFWLTKENLRCAGQQ